MAKNKRNYVQVAKVIWPKIKGTSSGQHDMAKNKRNYVQVANMI